MRSGESFFCALCVAILFLATVIVTVLPTLARNAGHGVQSPYRRPLTDVKNPPLRTVDSNHPVSSSLGENYTAMSSEVSLKKPPPLSQKRYLYFRPRLSGQNNNMQELICAAALAQKTGRCLVLPHLAESVTWERNIYDDLHPFTDYFDAIRFEKAIGCTSNMEGFREACGGSVDMDLYPRKGQKVTNLQYEVYMGLHIYCRSPKHQAQWRAVAESRLPAAEFERAREACAAVSRSRGAMREAVIENWVVGLTGASAAALPACLGVNWPCETGISIPLGLKKRHGDPALPMAFERSPYFRELRGALAINVSVAATAKNFIAEATNGRGYIAVHLRLGDFRTWCTSRPEAKRCPSFKTMAENMTNIAAQFNVTDVFVAVDPKHKAGAFAKLRSAGVEGLAALKLHTVPRDGAFARMSTDVLSVGEQTIAVFARAFVGNFYSSWTHTVHDLRLAKGEECDSLFFWSWRFSSCRLRYSVRANATE